MHLTYLSSLLTVGLLAPTAICAPLPGSRLSLKPREEVIGNEEGPEIQAAAANAPPSPPQPPSPPSNPPSHAPPGNANSGGGSTSSQEQANNILQAETAHNDGEERKFKRVEVVGESLSAETQHDTPPSPPSPPSPPKPVPASPPGHADPGNANCGATSKEAEDIVQAETAHDDGSEK